MNHGMLWRCHIDQLRSGPNSAQQKNRAMKISIRPELEEREEEQTRNREQWMSNNAASQAENEAEIAGAC